MSSLQENGESEAFEPRTVFLKYGMSGGGGRSKQIIETGSEAPITMKSEGEREKVNETESSHQRADRFLSQNKDETCFKKSAKLPNNLNIYIFSWPHTV